MDRNNCGFVHRGCHKYAEGGDGRLRGIVYLIRYEGLMNVLDFNNGMSNHLTCFAEYAADIYRAWDMLIRSAKEMYD
jgi:hypothetical protein